MNERCIVSVATGEFYCKMQWRLIESFRNSVDWIIVNYSHIEKAPTTSTENNGIDLMLWRDCLPVGSRPHSESPYGFKVHAIKAAYEKGYTSILWLDSPCVAVKEDISPIFDKIEKEGYYAMSHIDPLENWVGDTALIANGALREKLIGHNLPSGSCYGFNVKKSFPLNWPYHDGEVDLFWDLYLQEENGLFKNEKISDGKWHRHDEAILALCLLKRNMPIFTFDPLFQSDSEECVIKSGGW